jgi:hypothetical protein
VARSYRARDDGLFEVETPGLGYVPVHWGEDQLRAQGLEPLAPPEGRQAFVGDTPQAPSSAGGQERPAVPESRADVSSGPGTMAGDFSRYLETPGGETPAEEFPASFKGSSQSPNVSRLFEGKSASDLVLEGGRDKISEGDKAVDRKGPKTEAYRPGGAGSQNLSGGEGGGAGRARYATTKARDVRAAYRVDKGPQLDPENEALRSEAEIDTRLSMQERADREERRALQNVEQYESRVLAPMQRQISTDELKLDRMRQEYAKRQEQIDREREAVDKLEVNPNEVFEGREWAAVLAGLSILAGGALQGFQGRGDNPGLTAVNNAIDRSVQLQKDKIARRREGLAGKETALEKLMATYGNPEMAEAELRNRMSSLAEAWAKRHLMQGAAEDVQANLQQAFNERDLARVEERRQLDQAFGDRVSEQWQHVPAQTYQVGGQRPIPKEARNQAVVFPGGKVKYARGTGAAEKLQKTVADNAAMSGLLGDVVALVERGKGDRLWWDENRGRIQAVMTDVAAKYKSANELGTYDNGVAQLIDKGVGQPDSILGWDDAMVAKLRENQRLNQKNIETVDSYHTDDDWRTVTPGAGSRFQAESDR